MTFVSILKNKYFIYLAIIIIKKTQNLGFNPQLAELFETWKKVHRNINF